MILLVLTTALLALNNVPILAQSGEGNKNDFNGDGFEDIAIGVWREGIGSQERAGAVNVVHGSSSGLSATSLPDQFWHQDIGGVDGAAESEDEFGGSIAIGDFNRDGFSDMAVASYREDIRSVVDAGAVNVIYGSNVGLRTYHPYDQFLQQEILDTGNINEFQDFFGFSLAVGDFNGDTFDDLAVGVFGEDDEGHSGEGAVDVLYGTTSGLSVFNVQEWSQDSPDIEEVSEDADVFGAALGAADFNNDGYDDLAVGAFGETIGPYGSAGAVNVIYGSQTGLSATYVSDQVWSQDTPGILDSAYYDEQFGRVLATGDFNNDGFYDLAIGVPGEDAFPNNRAGAVHILFGSSNGLTEVDSQLITQNSPKVEGLAENGDEFGTSLASGDFNNDGFDDLAIGIPKEDIGEIKDAGATEVIYGSTTGLSAEGIIPDKFWYQDSSSVADKSETSDLFGTSLAVGDYNNDGNDDLAIGVPSEIVTSGGRGAVSVIYGSPSGLSATFIRDQFWSQDSAGVDNVAEPFDEFGFTLA